MEDGTASAIKQRDYKDATDLIPQGGAFDAMAFQSKASAQQSMNPSRVAPSIDVGKSDGLAVAHTLRAEHDASEDGTGRGTPIVFEPGVMSRDGGHVYRDGAASTLRKDPGDNHPCVAFAQNTRDEVRLQNGDGSIAGALAADPGMKQTTYAMQGMTVRRLTPIECERLQGFPDDYTRIAWNRKTPENCPDGPRYKSLGNSMAVNVMRWIGRRIEMVDEILLERPRKP